MRCSSIHHSLALAALLVACSPNRAEDQLTSVDTEATASDPPDRYGMNLSASDLLDRGTTACRLDAYLTEIEQAGHAKQVRFIFPPDWGPQILSDWIPIIRAHGFRVLVILSQSAADSDLFAQERWARWALPQVADILDAVNLLNEPNDTTSWSPTEYATWHRALVPVVREVVPGVPILAPTLNKVDGWKTWDRETGLRFGPDYDLRSANVTGWKTKDLKKLAGIVGAEPLWLTETGWPEQVKLRGLGVDVRRGYVFVWNGPEFARLARRPGGASPPVGCEVSPSPPPSPPPPAATCTYLRAGGGIEQGQVLPSCDGRFSLAMQSDGNLVLSQIGVGTLWSAGTNSARRAVMQSDGNFVLYDSAGRAPWSSRTWGHPDAFLAVQDDGNLVVYSKEGVPLWNSRTCCH